MAKIIVKKSTVEGKIRCPPSKSYSHRAIILSSLSNGVSNLSNVLFSRDTMATIDCCKRLGIEIEVIPEVFENFISPLNSTNQNKITNDKEGKYQTNDDNLQYGSLKITSNGGKNGFDTPDDILNAQNSGTTIRLITSMCSLVNDGYTILTGDNSLRRRPMKNLLKSLNELGVICFSSKRNDTPPVIVKGGGMFGGTTTIDGNISSQFLSSLLITGIYSKNQIIIKILGEQVSKPYVQATLATMDKFGIPTNSIVEHASKKENSLTITEVYSVPTGREYLPSTFKIPGDFSTAALLISAAFLTDGHLIIENVDCSLPQGDSRIINIIQKMGGSIHLDKSNGILTVDGKSNLIGGQFNLKDTPDLLPVVSILSLKSKNPTQINGIKHARYKETDRVANISSQLTKFGAKVKEEEDSLTINAPKKINNAVIDSFDDHRLFMAFTIAGLASEKSIIEGAQSVDVSYPNFLIDMKKLNANFEYLDV